MLNLVEGLELVINEMRSRSHLSILNNWQRQNPEGVWENLETVNSQQHKPMLSFLQGEENICLRQIWQVPESYGGFDILGATIRLNLTWWVDICEIWVNNQKIQEGDLFDQKCRILLTDHAIFGDTFILEIKLNSPKHDIGALQLSELVFEHLHQICDPDQFAIELEILQTYIPLLSKYKIDLQPLEIAVTKLINLFTNPQIITSNQFFELLSEIRQPLLEYSQFLKQRQIYILGNSHIDVAWLWAIAETKNAMQRTFRSALNLQEHYPELIFNQSTAISYEWMEQEYPELFERIKAAIAANKWELIGGMWVEPDGNLPSGESLIRQILYGQEYFKQKFNREVKIAWLPDTFGFHWQMPQILIKSGFKAFVTQKLMWNDTNKFPHQIFWWEGVDGSRIFTYFSNELGQGLEPVAIAKYIANQEQKHHNLETAWLYGVGDHGGGPTADMLNMGRKWADLPLFFTIKSSPLEQFILGLQSRLSVDLPVWQDELYLEFHRGTFTSKADQKYQNRQLEIMIGNAEKYSAIASLVNNIPYPQEQIEIAWKGLLLNQFHDILTGTSIPQVFADADRTWQELRTICDRLFSGKPCKSSKILENSNIQVWNFLNWSRSQLVRLADNSIYWLADIPSFGFTDFKSVAICETNQFLNIRSDREYFYLENNFIRVEISLQTGAIAQIFDKRSQLSILKSASEIQFFADKGQYWDAWNIDPDYESKKLESTTLQSITITENCSLLVSLTIIQKFRNSTFIQEIQLTAFEAFVTIKNWVDWQEEHILVKVAFPINWRSPYATYEIPMATIERSTLSETSEAKAKWEVPAQYWADIADSNLGLAILNDSKYGYDAKPDCLRLTLLRSPNWSCPNSDRGNHQFTYRLVPHHGNWRDANIVQLAQELNNPLVLTESQIPESQILKSQNYLQVSNSNIILSAFKRSQDHSGWIMRFYEAHGQTTITNIQLLTGLGELKSIWECDLMEAKQHLLSMDFSKVNSLNVTFQPYEIKTFWIK
jgi:alpha-mannosidase